MFLWFLCVFVQCCEYFQLFLCVEDQFYQGGDNERESENQAKSNVHEEGEGGPRQRYQENEDYTPMTTYPSDVIEEIPWEGNVETMMLQWCSSHHAKIENDLRHMALPIKSKQCLEIILHSLQKIINVYQNLGPMFDTFIDLMRRQK